MGDRVMRMSSLNFPKNLFQRHVLSYIHVDMLAQQKRGALRGLFVFGIGLTGILLSVGYFVYVQHQITLAENSDNQSVKPENHQIPITDKDELQQIQHASEQINIPWDILFVAVETVSSDKARIISLNPEPLKHSFTLMAESDDTQGMMEYVKALSGQKTLINVHLISQQTVVDGKKETLEFIVEGNWIIP